MLSDKLFVTDLIPMHIQFVFVTKLVHNEFESDIIRDQL